MRSSVRSAFGTAETVTKKRPGPISVMSAQIWERALEDLGDLDERFEQGEFGDLRDWLREHLYSLGAKFTPQETIERVTGSRIDARPYVRYLREKLAPQVA